MNGNGNKKLHLVYVIKSALNHTNQRSIIRKTWGNETQLPNVSIKTVFLLGSAHDNNLEAQEFINTEANRFADIIQGDFYDAYFNNTFKTMMGLKWVVQFCPDSQFYFFADDDYYVSTINALHFLHNPTQYPFYLKTPTKSEAIVNDGVKCIRRCVDLSKQLQLNDVEQLYTGYMHTTEWPHRDTSRAVIFNSVHANCMSM